MFIKVKNMEKCEKLYNNISNSLIGDLYHEFEETKFIQRKKFNVILWKKNQINFGFGAFRHYKTNFI